MGTFAFATKSQPYLSEVAAKGAGSLHKRFETAIKNRAAKIELESQLF